MSEVSMSVTPGICVLDDTNIFVPYGNAYYKVDNNIKIPLVKNSDSSFIVPENVNTIYYTAIEKPSTFSTFGTFYIKNTGSNNTAYLPGLRFSTYVPYLQTKEKFGNLVIIGDYNSAKSYFESIDNKTYTNSAFLSKLLTEYTTTIAEPTSSKYLRINYGDTETEIAALAYTGIKSDNNSNYGVLSEFSTTFDQLNSGRYRIKVTITPNANTVVGAYYGIRVVTDHLGGGKNHQIVRKWTNTSTSQTIYLDINDFIPGNVRSANTYKIQIITNATANIENNTDFSNLFIEPSTESRCVFDISCYSLSDSTGSILVNKFDNSKISWVGEDGEAQYDLTITGIWDGTQYNVAGYRFSNNQYVWSTNICKETLCWRDFTTSKIVISGSSEDEEFYPEYR